jgi:hypothetical protein
MVFSVGDRVRGRVWRQNFAGMVYAMTFAGRGLEMIVVRGDKELVTPMFTDSGDISSGETPLFSLMVKEGTDESIIPGDWIKREEE